MPADNSPDLRISASPTKEFFIFMLTRDVHLTRAIIDLVDNSVDGAQRLRGDGRYDGLFVRIYLGNDAFRVTDNCGGIPYKTARDYAFRFGRPKEAGETPHSVGLFGVGMKRTFFKLGRWFSVDSRCETERFSLTVDVDDWMNDKEQTNPEDWHFTFSTLETDLSSDPATQIGTTIEVKMLLPPVSASFGLDTFHQELLDELTAAHAVAVERGLEISVNDQKVKFIGQSLFVSDELRPAFAIKSYPRKRIDGRDGEPVNVRLYTGLSERDLHAGGWYIFCNGRLVVRSDQGSTTVWGKNHNMPQYHPDYAYFRGYAYLDSTHPLLLPWTTTKTGIDVDSGLYKAVQRQMIELTKPVLAFLRTLSKQRSGEEEGGWADGVLANAKLVSTRDITEPCSLSVPQPPPESQVPEMKRIQYWASASRVERAKAVLDVTSLKEVGERTFEYFMKYEAGEN